MLPLVVDASVALCWIIPGQDNVASIKALTQVELSGMVVPAFWHMEITNQLGLKRRAEKISAAELDLAFVLFDRLSIRTIASDLISPAAIAFMNRFRLTAYDAVYLSTALLLRLPLATFDLELIRAAREVEVPLL